MLALAPPIDAVLSCQASATRCPGPGAAPPALKWVAIASAMVTKLPLNMLTPDLSQKYLS
jgi:hypothetical protein